MDQKRPCQSLLIGIFSPKAALDKPSVLRLLADKILVSSKRSGTAAVKSKSYTLTEIMLNEWRAEGAQTMRLNLAQGAGIWIEADRRPTLHLVVAGNIALTQSDGTSRQLAAGDCALNFYGERQLLGEGANAGIFEVPPWDPLDIPDRIAILDIPFDNPSQTVGAIILTFFLVVPNVGNRTYANRAVPELVVMSDRPNRRPLPLGIDPRRLLTMLEGPGSNAIAAQLGAWLLTLAEREIAIKIVWGEGIQSVRTPSSSQISAILRELRTWPAKPWTVPLMARRVGLSRSTFVSAFTEATGLAPMAFLTRQRMEMAARLMGSQVLTPQQVAQMTGYVVYKSFARAFKRHWGLAPALFRKSRVAAPQAIAQ